MKYEKYVEEVLFTDASDPIFLLNIINQHWSGAPNEPKFHDCLNRLETIRNVYKS